MAEVIRLAFSPCPNDTFIFDAIVHKKIDLEGLVFDFRMEDVETLNQLAFGGKTEMVKVSFHAFFSLTEKFELLRSGSALGFGNGPLLIAGKNIPLNRIPGMTVAIPGIHTTAHLLFRMAFPDAARKKFMVFSLIEHAILEGKVDAGVIIHENRFTYEKKGLVRLLDLGEYWQERTGGPIPLGGIIVKKELGDETIAKLNRVMRRSVEFALKYREEAMDFVRQNAQEMEEEVMKKHIGLFVNDFTVDLGEQGFRAIDELKTIFMNTASTKKTE